MGAHKHISAWEVKLNKKNNSVLVRAGFFSVEIGPNGPSHQTREHVFSNILLFTSSGKFKKCDGQTRVGQAKAS